MDNSPNSRNSGSPLAAATSSSFDLGSIPELKEAVPASTSGIQFYKRSDMIGGRGFKSNEKIFIISVDMLENLEKNIDDINNLLTGAVSRIAFLERELAKSRQKSMALLLI